MCQRRLLESGVNVCEMYAGANAMFRPMNGDSQYFRLEVCHHQSPASNPFLFVTVMDVLSDNIRNGELWALMLTDDLVITAESKDDLQSRVLQWQELRRERN